MLSKLCEKNEKKNAMRPTFSNHKTDSHRYGDLLDASMDINLFEH